MALYQQDLAYVHSTAFEGLARGAAPEIIRRLNDAAIPINDVLDVGCGAGPLTAALIKSGFHVTGVDPSPDLLAIARANNPSATFLQASIYDIELPPCQAILAVGEPFTYHADMGAADSLVTGFIERCAATLPAGGLLIFDIIELGAPSLNARNWAAGDDWAVLSETTEVPQSRKLIRHIETFRRDGRLYRRAHEEHSVRLFDTAELTAILHRTGFNVETGQHYGDHRLAPRRRAFFATRR